jgi:hypothetical protein
MRRLVVIVAAVVLASAGVASAIIAGTPAPVVDLGQPQDLRTALIAVHAYVEKRRTPLREFLANVTTPSMPTAAQAIVDSHDPLEVAARMLATVRLVAHAREQAEAVQAVDTLITKPTRERLFKWLDENSSCGGSEEEKRVAEGLKAVLADEKPHPLSNPGACSDFFPYSNVDSPSTTNDVTIKINADAGRRFDDARVKVDPQNWARCSQTAWRKTCLVELQNGMAVMDSNGDPKCQTSPPAPGSGYVDQVLFEEATCEGKCQIKMLLDVDATLTPNDKYLLQYNWKQQLNGTPELVVDDGHLKITKDGNRVWVDSEKVVGFQSSSNATLVYAVLGAVDMSAHLQRLVCCP